MQPSVSIIIPCYNAEKFIEETIHSVLQQSFTDWELLVINDGSTDNSEVIIKKITDPRIRLFSKPNTGVSDSRNVGLENAAGEFIWFLDADDLMSVDFLETRIHFLLANPSCLIAGGKLVHIDEAGKYTGSTSFTPDDEIAVKQILFFYPSISTCPSAFLIRRNFLKEYKIRFEHSLWSTADKLFLLQIAQHVKFKSVEGGELFYRRHSKSMSSQYTSALVDDNERYFKLIEEMNLVPAESKKKFILLKWYNLSASNFKVKRYARSFHFLKLFLFSLLGHEKS
jgi:teichuronic acid biosynthesis glycosyltransferase TuaG